MFIGMVIRQFIIEFFYTATFLSAFHLVSNDTFEMFVVFALFTIFLRARLTHDFAELRAQGYLIMRMLRIEDSELAKLRGNMETTFDADDLLTQFSEGNTESVSGDYTGRLFARSISWVAQAWMLGFIVWHTF